MPAGPPDPLTAVPTDADEHRTGIGIPARPDKLLAVYVLLGRFQQSMPARTLCCDGTSDCRDPALQGHVRQATWCAVGGTIVVMTGHLSQHAAAQICDRLLDAFRPVFVGDSGARF